MSLGILDGKTSGYFLTSVVGYFRFISSYVLTSDVGIGLAAPKLHHKFLQVYPFPVGILLPV